MQLASGTHIPDGLLAANVLLSEKPRHGVASKNPALNQGINEANSTAAIGLRASEHLNRARYRYTGKERDSESGLDYFGARYYSSNVGRWLSPDWADRPEAVPYSDLDNPQSMNLYGYGGNNPLSRVDADGHEDRLQNYTSRAITFAAGAINVGVGSSKAFAGVVEALAAPETGGAAGVVAAYQMYQAHGQVLAGAAQITGALANQTAQANDVADTLTIGTSVAGMATLAFTNDKDKAGLVATVEGIATGAATRSLIKNATNIIDAANNLFSGATQAKQVIKNIPTPQMPIPKPPAPRKPDNERPDKQGDIPNTAKKS